MGDLALALDSGVGPEPGAPSRPAAGRWEGKRRRTWRLPASERARKWASPKSCDERVSDAMRVRDFFGRVGASNVSTLIVCAFRLARRENCRSVRRVIA